MPLRLSCHVALDFEVTVGRGLLAGTSPILAEAVPAQRGLVVVDADVDRLHGNGIRDLLLATMPGFALYVIAAGEADKSMATVLDLCSQAQHEGLGRRDALVAIGGGVCCDVVSVAATLIRRGLPYVCVPTTLLGQIDAGIGVKGAVNFGPCKNYLGAFYPPAAVICDLDFLASLPVAELRSGMAEMLKMALLRDPALFGQLQAHGPSLVATGFAEPDGVGEDLVRRSAQLMLEELGKDPYESGALARLVDFGHTFSPVLEARSEYRLRHGEAVAIDMALSALLALELGLACERDVDEILALMLDLGLPVTSPLVTDDALDHALEAGIAHRGGSLNLVVPLRIGASTFIRSRAAIPPEALAMTRLRAATYQAAVRRPSSPTEEGEVLAPGGSCGDAAVAAAV